MTSTPHRIVVVGSLNVDHTVRVERLPVAGATILATGYDRAPGGKGLNQAVAAARQGAAVDMVGAVGDDAAGDQLAGVLAEEGIGTAGLARRSGASGTALITVAADGANTIVVAAGTNGEVAPGDVFAADFAGAAVVLGQLEIPMPAVRAALAAGRAAGAVTVLNPAPAPAALPADLLELVDVVVPNETEAAALVELLGGTGANGASGSSEPGPTDEEEIRAAARRAGAALVAAGAGTAVVTLGRLGATVVPGDGTAPWDVAPFAVEAVDTTAAGDAFIGALVAALAEGRPLADAARRGAAAGAVAACRPGAVPSLPTRAEVDARLSEQG